MSSLAVQRRSEAPLSFSETVNYTFVVRPSFLVAWSAAVTTSFRQQSVAVAVFSSMVSRLPVLSLPVPVDDDNLSNLCVPLEILRQKQDAASRMVESRLVNLESDGNDFGVKHSTVLCSCAALTLCQSEKARLQDEASRLSSKPTSVHTFREEKNSHRQRLLDSTAEAKHLLSLPNSALLSITGGLWPPA